MDHDIFDGGWAIAPKNFCTTHLDKKRVMQKKNLEQTAILS